MIRQAPRTPRVTNQMSMTGPKMPPILFVPLCWIQNRQARMAHAIAGMNGVKAGLIASKPSAAPRTDMAGVMIPSP